MLAGKISSYKHHNPNKKPLNHLLLWLALLTSDPKSPLKTAHKSTSLAMQLKGCNMLPNAKQVLQKLTAVD